MPFQVVYATRWDSQNPQPPFNNKYSPEFQTFLGAFFWACLELGETYHTPGGIPWAVIYGNSLHDYERNRGDLRILRRYQSIIATKG